MNRSGQLRLFDLPGLWRLGVLLFVLIAGPALLGAGVTATLDSDTVVLGESVALTISFEGGAPEYAPDPPRVPGLSISFASQGTRATYINGDGHRYHDFVYGVQPQREGQYIIPAMTFKVAGATISTQPVQLKAYRSDDAEAQNDLLRKLAFMRINAPTNDIYVGQVFPAEIQLFTQNGSKLAMSSIAADGFVVGQPQKPSQGNVQINNQIYVQVGSKFTATPVKIGELTLGPAEWALDIVIPTQRRRTRDPFGDLGSIFGERSEIKRVNLNSGSVKIRVLPLPTTDVPAAFQGAIGSFLLRTSVTPTNVAVGDPVTVKMEIIGRGAFDNLLGPSLTGLRDFKVYPATSKVETTDPLGMEGRKTFEQVVVPENAEVRELPAVQFAFFDPLEKRYKTLQSAPTPLIVRPVAASAGQVAGQSSKESPTEEQKAAEIIHIKPRPGALALIRPPLLQQGWFLGAQCVPLGLLMAAYLWRRRAENIQNNPRLRRRKETDAVIRSGILELRAAQEQGDGPGFYALLFRLTQERVGEFLDMPASAITEAVIEERLLPARVPAEIVEGLRQIFQACDAARYSTGEEGGEMAALIKTIESVFKRFEEVDRP